MRLEMIPGLKGCLWFLVEVQASAVKIAEHVFHKLLACLILSTFSLWEDLGTTRNFPACFLNSSAACATYWREVCSTRVWNHEGITSIVDQMWTGWGRARSVKRISTPDRRFLTFILMSSNRVRAFKKPPNIQNKRTPAFWGSLINVCETKASNKDVIKLGFILLF